MQIAVRQKSYFSIGVISSALIHIALLYALFAKTVYQQPILQKTDIIHIDLLDAPSPLSPILAPLETMVPPVQKNPVAIKSKTVSKPKEVYNQKPDTIQKSITSNEVPSIDTSKISQTMVSNASEQSTTSVQESKSSSPSDTLAYYLLSVRKKIQSHLIYPSMARKMNLEGEIMVQFAINTDGEVDKTSLKIFKSSGTKILDKYALEAVLDASPFEKPPHEEMNIHVPVIFKVKS